MTAATLRIRRALTRAFAPAGAPLPTIKSKLEAALEDRFAGCLEDALPAGRDEGLWLIHRLRVRASVASHWTAGEMARQLAKGCIVALSKTLDAGPDADEVLWFPSEGAYLAHFLADCAEGRAFGRWRYARFEHLAGLSLSASLRQALVAEPEVSRQALAELLPREPDAIIRALTPQDAEQILDALAMPAEADYVSVVEALDELVGSGRLPTDRRLAGLAIFVEAGRKSVFASAAHLRDAASTAAAFRNVGVLERERLATWLTDGDFAAIARRFKGEIVADLLGLFVWPEAERRRLVAVLASPGARTETTERRTSSATRHGGVFLLLPLLDEFEWEPNGLPGLGDTSATDLMRFLTVVAAFGRPRNLAAFNDRVLRFACGIPEGLDAPDIASWAAKAPRRSFRLFREAWTSALSRKGYLSGVGHSVDVKRNRLGIDDGRGIWVSLSSAGPSNRSSAKDVGAHRMGVPPEPAPGARQTPLSGRESHSNTSATRSDVTAVKPSFEPLAANQWIRADLDYAALDPALRLPAQLRRLLALTSQNVLRTFAWHLPGFAGSSLQYLFANFLDCGATVLTEEDRFVVQMDRPALHVVLNMTSLSRKTFRLPATGDRPWVLTPRL